MNPKIFKKNQVRQELVVTKVLDEVDPAYVQTFEKPNIDEKFFESLNFFDEILNITKEIFSLSVDVGKQVYPDIIWAEQQFLETKLKAKDKTEQQEFIKSSTLNLKKRRNEKLHQLEKKTQKRVFPLNNSIHEDLIINKLEQNVDVVSQLAVIENQAQNNQDSLFLQSVQQQEKQNNQHEESKQFKEAIIEEQTKQNTQPNKKNGKKGRKKGGKNKSKNE